MFLERFVEEVDVALFLANESLQVGAIPLSSSS